MQVKLLYLALQIADRQLADSVFTPGIMILPYFSFWLAGKDKSLQIFHFL